MKMGRPSGLTVKDIVFNDVSEIEVEKIIVKNRKREADEAKVNELIESIKELGLISPIYVNRSGDDYVLIAGLHRLTAYKKLGIDRIPAKITDLDNIHSELAEIDENLVRAELHYLDRAEMLKRRQEIYEELHPEAKAEEKRKSAGANNLQKFLSGETVSPLSETNNDELHDDDVDTFTEDTAKKTNLTERTIQQDLQIAKNLDDGVKKQIKEKKLSKGEALEIARLKKDDQQKAIDERTKKPKNKKQKEETVAYYRTLIDYQNDVITHDQAEETLLGLGISMENIKKYLKTSDDIKEMRKKSVIEEILEAYRLDSYTYEEAEKLLTDETGSIKEARYLLATYKEKEISQQQEQSNIKTGEETNTKTQEPNDNNQDVPLEDKIKRFNTLHNNIFLELGKAKDIKSYSLSSIQTGEAAVIKIAFKSQTLVNDLINILNKSFPVK